MQEEISFTPFVGRKKELTELRGYLDDAAAGHGNVILISGEAGIGKTRLVKELENDAELSGFKILEGRCLIESQAPLLPFREALRGISSIVNDDSDKIRQKKIKMAMKKSYPHFMYAIPVVGPAIAGVGVAVETYKSEETADQESNWCGLFKRDEAFEAIARLLATISEEQPTVLFIDDLHAADSASLGLLYYIARNVRSSKLLVVGTYRQEDVVKPVAGTIPPLQDILQRMSRDDLYQSMQLQRLDENALNDLVKLSFDIDPGDLTKLVNQESEGNPFYANEILRLLLEQHILVKKDNSWTLTQKIEDIDIPTRILDIIKRRIIRLTDEEREMLDCAAVIGDEFSSEILESVLGQNRLSILKSLSKVARERHLIHSKERGYRFDHSKIREVLYNEMAPELREEYHTLVAAFIEEKCRERPDEAIYDLAYHYYRSKDSAKATPYLIQAGNDAKEKWAVFEAVKFYSQALELMESDSSLHEDRIKTLESLGDVFALIDQHEEANECFVKGAASTQDPETQECMHRKVRHKRILAKNGVKLAYYVYGEGAPTLIFVVAWIWTAALWIPQVMHFCKNYRVITIDMRGTGESDKPLDDYTPDLYAEDLHSIIKEIDDKKKIILVGESMGATIAMRYVAKYPGMIDKLVLLSGSPKFIATEDFPFGWSQSYFNEGMAMWEASHYQGLKTTMDLFFPELGTDYLKEWGLAMAQKTNPHIILNSLKNLFEADLRPMLKDITMPTLIVQGDSDGVVHKENARYLQNRIRRSDVHLFKNKGHFPSITSADEFNRILQAFIL